MFAKETTRVVAVLALISLLGATATPRSHAAGLYRAALVIAQGGLGDQAYNDLGYSGLQKAAHDFSNVVVRPIQSPDIVSQGATVLRTAGAAGFNEVIDLEFSNADAMAKVAPQFPNTQFAIVNTVVKGPNVTSVLFNEQDGSYLAGALSAMVTENTKIPGINAQKVIGVIGGTKSTGIDKFIVGYIEGAHAVDPQVKVLVAYSNNFGDPAKGKALAMSMFQQGADIVYQVAGGTGVGVIEAAKDTGHYAIGVDADQDFLAPGHVLTSMIKHTDVAVYDLVKLGATGKLHGGSAIYFGLADGGIDLSPMKYTRKLIPPAYLARVATMKQQIIGGKIKVWNVINQGYPTWFK
jgi:basic membrane protein A and related proteins